MASNNTTTSQWTTWFTGDNVNKETAQALLRNTTDEVSYIDGQTCVTAMGDGTTRDYEVPRNGGSACTDDNIRKMLEALGSHAFVTALGSSVGA